MLAVARPLLEARQVLVEAVQPEVEEKIPGLSVSASERGGLGVSADRRRCRRFLRYTLPSSVVTWYERTPASPSVAWVHL